MTAFKPNTDFRNTSHEFFQVQKLMDESSQAFCFSFKPSYFTITMSSPYNAHRTKYDFVKLINPKTGDNFVHNKLELNFWFDDELEVEYRYGFQGQESDNEIKGKGNSINYKYRMHDPRLGRFFAVDPLASAFPHNSPYAFSENIVINAVELEGLEKVYVYNVYKKYGMTVRKLSHTYIDENLTDHRRVYRYFNENGEKEKTVNQDINDSERNPNKDFYGNMISSSYEDGDYWQSFVWATKKKDNDLKGKNGVKEGMKLIGATVGTILSGGTLAMATGAWATTTGVVSLVLSIDGLTEVNDNTILDHLMREKFGENGPKLLDGAKLALSVKDAAKGITNFTLKLSSGEMIDGTIDVINQTYNIGNVILDVKEKKEKQ